ncbi:hypothetical protein SOVF_100370, partial [Spinacia oleracea]
FCVVWVKFNGTQQVVGALIGSTTPYMSSKAGKPRRWNLKVEMYFLRNS